MTGRFATDATETVDLSLGGHDRPIGVTPKHPMYSLDRRTWVPAGDLQPGERLETATGEMAIVERVESCAGRATVYNVEISRYHTYFVGEAQVWAHNPCNANKLRHIFGNPEHKLEPLRRAFGGNEMAAFSAVEAAANSAAKGLTNGVRRIAVSVRGLTITVKGMVTDGAI